MTLSPTFFVVPRAAVGDFGCSAHGSNFVALTATLEAKLSSRTLEDIIEEQLVRISTSGNAIFQKLALVECGGSLNYRRACIRLSQNKTVIGRVVAKRPRRLEVVRRSGALAVGVVRVRVILKGAD